MTKQDQKILVNYIFDHIGEDFQTFAKKMDKKHPEMLMFPANPIHNGGTQIWIPCGGTGLLYTVHSHLDDENEHDGWILSEKIVEIDSDVVNSAWEFVYVEKGGFFIITITLDFEWKVQSFIVNDDPQVYIPFLQFLIE